MTTINLQVPGLEEASEVDRAIRFGELIRKIIDRADELSGAVTFLLVESPGGPVHLTTVEGSVYLRLVGKGPIFTQAAKDVLGY